MQISVDKQKNGSKITIFHMQNLSTVPTAKVFCESKFCSVSNFKIHKTIIMSFRVTLRSIVFSLLEKEWVRIFFFVKILKNDKIIFCKRSHSKTKKDRNV